MIVIQLQLDPFSPHPSTPPQMTPPPSSTSILPLDLGCLSSWSGVMWVIYIFWRSNPCPKYHCQIYFPVKLVLFFILMLFSLAVQKLLIFMRSHFFILSFKFLAPGDILMKILLHETSDIFLPLFFSMTFMMSQFIFKSFTHLEFIFVYGVSWCSSFFSFFLFFFFAFSCPDRNGLPTPFIEEAIFTPCYASAHFVEYYLTIETGFICGLYILFLWSMCLLLCQ